MTARTAGTPDRWTRRLLRCGLAAGPVFTATFLLEGATRDGYRPLRHPVSSLALGPRGWVQTAHFTVTGTLFLARAARLSRGPRPQPRRSRPGPAHNLAAIPFFAGLPAAALVTGRRSGRTGQRGFTRYSAV